MKRALALVFILIIVVILITLQIKNPEYVGLSYYFGINTSLPILVVVIVPFLAGLLMGVLFMSLSLFKQKRSLGKTKKDLAKAEQEVQNLRSMPIKNEV